MSCEAGEANFIEIRRYHLDTLALQNSKMGGFHHRLLLHGEHIAVPPKEFPRDRDLHVQVSPCQFSWMKPQGQAQHHANKQINKLIKLYIYNILIYIYKCNKVTALGKNQLGRLMFLLCLYIFTISFLLYAPNSVGLSA